MAKNSKNTLILILLIFLISLSFMLFLIREIFQPPTRKQNRSVLVQHKMKNVYFAIKDYNLDYGEYPNPEKWCDLILPYLDYEKDIFILPTSVGEENTIALNPDAKPDSPKDVVLLFESTGGPNAHGQAELLAPISNGKPGCFVVFNDGEIKFIKPEQTKELNWGNNEVTEK